MARSRDAPKPIVNACPRCDSVYFELAEGKWTRRVCGADIPALLRAEMQCNNCEITHLMVGSGSPYVVEALSCHFCAGCEQHLGRNHALAINNWRPRIARKRRGA